MISKDEMPKLLNRSLSTAESDNFNLYLKIARLKLEELLCTKFDSDGDDRTFATRQGYSTLYTDVFTDIEEVRVNGLAVDETTYIKKNNDSYNSDWYNSIEFLIPMPSTLVTIQASWGFDCMPDDLKLLLAKLFGDVTTQSSGDIKSEKIEDYSVTYKDDVQTDTVSEYQSVINKYGLCQTGNIQHGRLTYEPLSTPYYY